MSDKKKVKTRQVVTAHPSSLKHSNTNVVEPTSIWFKLKKHWPITMATILSMAWLGLLGFAASTTGFNLAESTLVDLSMIVSVAMLPMILIWVLCLVIIRVNPIEENYRSLENGLDQLLNPVEITQDRIVKVIENLKSEIEKIDAAGEVAANRFKNLEDGFKAQIEELFKATIDADEKSALIKENLEGERKAIKTLAEDIEKHSDAISSQLKQYRDETVQTNEATKKHSENLNNEISFQNKTLDNRAKQIEESLESLGKRLSKISDEVSDQSNHSYHHLSEIIDGFDERRAVLNNFMTSMMDEVNSICDKLETQAKTVSKLSNQSSKTSEKITKNIKKQSEELAAISEQSVSNITASGKAIEDQAKLMEQSISEASERGKMNIAEASDYFMEKANDLDRVSGDLENNIKQNFDEITDTITDKAAALGEDISIRFETIEADIDRGNSNITELLEANIARLNEQINANKVSTETMLADVTTSIDQQSEHIEKSLADTRINMIDRTTLIQEEYQSLESFAEKFQSRMVETEQEFKKQHDNMLSCITIIEDGLTVAIDKIKKNSTSLGSHGQKVIESVISQTSELTNQIADIQNRSKNSILEIQNASQQANDNILSTERETSEVIAEWISSANAISVDHMDAVQKIQHLLNELAVLEQTTEKTISSSEENIKRISSELLRNSDSIHMASTSAIEAFEETNQALDKNAEKYQQMINAIQLSSQSLATNANAIEKRMKDINSDKFAKISAQIMQKLQSEAIDISSYLEGDIPKDLWNKYLDGDKNLFIRKIKKYVGKNTIAGIKAAYMSNTDFRNNVDHFIHIFEELLATFNESTETVYRETLLTSDIGKVYFALSEATGRFK